MYNCNIFQRMTHTLVKKLTTVLLIAILATLSQGCVDKQEELLWQKAQSSNSVQMYQNFLDHYPESQYVDSVHVRIEALLHPLKDEGFPDLELISSDIGMTCWDDSVITIAYRISKPTFISWDDLERHFNWESEGARQWYPKGDNVSSAGFRINQDGEQVSFGSTCIGYDKIILISGTTINKSNGILFEENSIIVHQKY